MNKAQAQQWVQQELAKITNIEQAQAHLASFVKSRDTFFDTPAGQAAALANPHARNARYELAEAVCVKFQLPLV